MREIIVYIVWAIDADSWTGRKTLLSIHQTIGGAEGIIPEREKKLERAPGEYVKNYTYYAIEKRTVGA